MNEYTLEKDNEPEESAVEEGDGREEGSGVLFIGGDLVFFGKKEEEVLSLIEAAKERDLNSWKENQVYEEVEREEGTNTVSTK